MKATPQNIALQLNNHTRLCKEDAALRLGLRESAFATLYIGIPLLRGWIKNNFYMICIGLTWQRIARRRSADAASRHEKTCIEIESADRKLSLRLEKMRKLAAEHGMPPISMERYPGKEYVLRILCVECAIFVRVLRGIEETLQIALWLELKQVIDNKLVYSLRGEAINALTLIHDTVLGNDYPEKG